MNCFKCDISIKRKHLVRGYGNINAKIMLLGEAPGYYEDKFGIPFVGVSGKKLNEILHLCNWTREEHVYITNIIKCRPPGNRIPSELEISNCKDILKEELELVKPILIITLGATAFSSLTNVSLSITKIRGKVLPLDNYTILPTYHPSYVLRNPDIEQEFISDFKKALYIYRTIINPVHTDNF